MHQGFLPDRLIEVSNEGSVTRLVSKTDVQPGSAYATLSHRWGSLTSSRTSKLTAATMHTFEKGMSIEELPTTFADACRVCRSLGIRYLWIDSLCIVQDSNDDKQRNLANMWKIYMHSYLNLSATASGRGLFRERDKATIHPCTAKIPEDNPQLEKGDYICYNDEEWSLMVDMAPVNTRAWVFQERMLASRVVHFSQNQLFWECFEMKSSERFPDGIPQRYECATLRDTLNKDLTLTKSPTLLVLWAEVVATYSFLELTYESDKLVALSALVQLLHDAFRDKYLAGLWQGNLTGQLCWLSSAQTRRSTVYRAPSWSWVCLDGPVSPQFDETDHDDQQQGGPACKTLITVISIFVDDKCAAPSVASNGVLFAASPLLPIKLTTPKARMSDEAAGYPSSRERREDMVKVMSHVKPNYSGENMMTFGISEGPRPTGISGTQTVTTDVQEGAIIIDGRQEENIGGPEHELKWTKRHLQMNVDGHDNDVFLDEDPDSSLLESTSLFFLPVLCRADCTVTTAETAFEIDVLKGLILTQVGQSGENIFRRIGVGHIDEYGAMPFLCRLADSETDEPSLATRFPLYTRRLQLDDFVPEKWTGKTLDFMPRDFACYEVVLI